MAPTPNITEWYIAMLTSYDSFKQATDATVNDHFSREDFRRVVDKIPAQWAKYFISRRSHLPHEQEILLHRYLSSKKILKLLFRSFPYTSEQLRECDTQHIPKNCRRMIKNRIASAGPIEKLQREITTANDTVKTLEQKNITLQDDVAELTRQIDVLKRINRELGLRYTYIGNGH